MIYLKLISLADDLGWNSLGYEPYDLDFATPMLTKLVGVLFFHLPPSS